MINYQLCDRQQAAHEAGKAHFVPSDRQRRITSGLHACRVLAEFAGNTIGLMQDEDEPADKRWRDRHPGAATAAWKYSR